MHRPDLARTALVLLGITLGLGALEIGLRTAGTIPEVENPLYSFHQSDAALGWIGVPGIRQRFVRDAFDVLIEHTDEGFRKPHPPPPERAPHQVLLLGDSFTWGWGVDPGEVFTDRLQRALGDGVALHNRGVNAFGTSQQLLLQRRALAQRDYDDVVLVFTQNDFTDNLDSKAGRRPYFTVGDDGLVPHNQPPARLMSPVAAFAKRSHALAWIDHRVTGLLGGHAAPDGPATPTSSGAVELPAAPPDAVAVTTTLLRTMRDEAGKAGARFTVVVAQEGPRRAQLLAICRAEALSCIDLAPTLHDPTGTRGLYLPGDGHWTPEGHRLVAQALRDAPPLHGTNDRREDGGRSRPDPGQP